MLWQCLCTPSSSPDLVSISFTLAFIVWVHLEVPCSSMVIFIWFSVWMDLSWAWRKWFFKISQDLSSFCDHLLCHSSNYVSEHEKNLLFWRSGLLWCCLSSSLLSGSWASQSHGCHNQGCPDFYIPNQCLFVCKYQSRREYNLVSCLKTWIGELLSKNSIKDLDC